jgi:hypothetical protein
MPAWNGRVGAGAVAVVVPIMVGSIPVFESPPLVSVLPLVSPVVPPLSVVPLVPPLLRLVPLALLRALGGKGPSVCDKSRAMRLNTPRARSSV